MIEVSLECQYCGHKWIYRAYSKASIDKLKCNKCSDSNLTVRNLSDNKIDYYQGSPAFPQEGNDFIPDYMMEGTHNE